MRLPSFRRGEGEKVSGAGALGRFSDLPSWARIALIGLALALAWYGLIGGLRAGIHAEPASRPGPELLPPGGSETLGMAALLLDQQVNSRAFTPNDPFFYPTALARRTPAFQARLVETVSASVAALASGSGRPLLTRAADALATPADQWLIGRRFPFLSLPAEVQYRRAVGALADENREIAANPRARRQLVGLGLVGTLADRVEAEAELIADHRRGPARESDAVRLASARGVALAAAMLLRGIREDEAELVRLSGQAARWGEAIDALDNVARLDPILVRDSHLVEAAYALLLASRAMRDSVAPDR
jgi:hypothetical protein